ncbi:hypothetical protein NP233_g10566 [Leucocoprinus birnbaumii]|uniref:WW domain-containing protein n=1 Tax=Leucocoprinus birnbaumii TaxID=56174 RepID=A0AAD5VI46_9AGAR|nr:hypothetical protein NP233_g10566 [Leucocoprinus birnbaumii]
MDSHSQEADVSSESTATYVHTSPRSSSPISTSASLDPSILVLPNEIYPSSPTYTLRYSHDRKRDDKSSLYPIQPGRVIFKDEGLPPGWLKCIHPEGLPFFYRLPSSECPMRVLTDEWLYNQETASHISNFLNEILRAIADFNATIHPNSDLVLELQLDRGIWKCGYYFVHHPSKCVYWLEEVNLEYLSKEFEEEVRGDVAHSQVETCMELEYWVFWDCFPNLQEATPDVYDYTMSAIMAAITGRFMRYIVSDRLRNYYGAYGARISRTQTVLKIEPEGRSKFFWLFSPFLFFIPNAQLERVEPLLADRHVIVIYWTKFFGELHEEWNQTMTLVQQAAIMLAANCAFLAIPIFQPDDDSPHNLANHSTPAQIASYFSLVSSLYGFILSMVMYRQQKVRSPDTPKKIIDYVYNNTQSGPRHRLQHLVLIWSLPACPFLVAVSASLLSSLVFYYTIRFGSGKNWRALWTKRAKRVVLRFKSKFQSSSSGASKASESISEGSGSEGSIIKIEICVK